MVNKLYELIEHTADTGIKVKARNLKELFEKAALSLFDIIAEKKPPRSSIPKSIKIKLKAGDREGLFINWLNELLSLSAAKELIFHGFKINKLSENEIEAVITGRGAKNYRVNVEVKAATYHQLKIEKIKSGWQAEVILDV